MNFTEENIIEALNGLLIGKSEPLAKGLFSSVTNDSRKVTSSVVFTAILGSSVNGHDFIDEAVAKGAKVIIHQEPVKKIEGVSFLHVSDSYSAYARLAEVSYCFPAQKMNLIAITGTNGKTTTAYLLRSILEESKGKCGLISTVEYAYPGMAIPAERTTPDALKLQRLLYDFCKADCEYAVMEISSHALDQNRTGTAKFATAIFTNLSGDHLDYHCDMESYFRAKKVLFQQHLLENARPVVNIDDIYGRRLVCELSPKAGWVTFGRTKDADIKIRDIHTSCNGTKVSIDIKGKTQEFSSRLYGEFNAYNIAAAVAAADALGIDNDVICSGIEKMRAVPGRMEGFVLPSGALAVVDYAHTDDALENVLKTLREVNDKGQLTVVFGCGGDRDKGKRPRMGAVAAKLADKIIVTSDNPRTESTMDIIEDILKGISERSNLSVIPERSEAIIKAISSCDSEGVVLIAGKGHENYQEICGTKYFLDDRVLIREYISRYIS